MNLPDLPRARRSKFDIVALLLEIAAEGSTKTALVYKSNLNFKLVQKYVDMLRGNELLDVVEDGGSTVYRTTHKGVDALRAILSATELISGNAVSGAPPLLDSGWRTPGTRIRAAFPPREPPLTRVFESVD